MIYLPPSPVEGQQYVAVNAVTYTFLDGRWSSVDSIQKQQAEFYIDGGDASFIYAANRDGLLDGGTA